MIGGGFLTYCVKQGWLTQEGKGNKTRYFATGKGRHELAKFDIHI
jgi:DNA-binding transcriptional regulator PaaX